MFLPKVDNKSESISELNLSICEWCPLIDFLIRDGCRIIRLGKYSLLVFQETITKLDLKNVFIYIPHKEIS